MAEKPAQPEDPGLTMVSGRGSTAKGWFQVRPMPQGLLPVADISD